MRSATTTEKPKNRAVKGAVLVEDERPPTVLADTIVDIISDSGEGAQRCGQSFGAIAATIILAALLVSLLILWRENRTNRKELARLSAEIKQAQAQLDREHKMGEILTSPDAHMAKLAGTNVAPGAHAMLAYDRNGHAMLMAKGLPAAPEGMAYQLWFIKDNKKMPGRVFTTDAAGNGMLDDQIPEAARNAAVFAITLEPRSGVQVPTGSIYLLSAS